MSSQMGGSVASASVDSSQTDQPRTPPQSALVTRLLVATCILIFSAMAFRQVSTHAGSEPLLLRWGANFGPLTLSGQWWRLFTSLFPPSGVVHLAVNMWCLWDLGSFAERIYGRSQFLMIYLIAGVIGALCSVFWHPFALAAGASGAIFGVTGALLASFIFGDLPFTKKSAAIALLSVIAFAGYNLFVGIVGKGPGNAAHVGGLISGFLLALLISRTSFRKALLLGALSIVLGCVFVGWKRGYVVTAEQARIALANGQSDRALQMLTESLRKNPEFADGYKMRGQAFMQKKQFADAEAAYRRALAMQPKDSSVSYQLGMALLAQGRTNDSLELFNRLAAENPRSYDAQMGVGAVAELQGNFQLAFDAFDRATNLAPRDSQAYSNLGLAALQLHKPDEAITAFSKCTQLEPNNPNFMMSLAIAYKSKGMQKEAEQSYQHAVALAKREKK